MRDYSPKGKQYAREMRRNMTPQESRLWYEYLSKHTEHFRRQQPIGKYIVDFYAARLRFAVEVDGSRHFDEEGRLYDAERTAFLREYRIHLLRFTNGQIERNFSAVCEAIARVMDELRAGNEYDGAEEDGHVF